MVISPPFLPVPTPGESEADWLARAMKQQVADAIHSGAQEGSFPISASHMWHNGIHLSAPPAPGGVHVVRAVADGRVIYVRQPTPHSTDPAHPLNYSPGGQAFWSDDGCVIVRHSTDIGAANEVTTGFTWYTLTMHLRTVESAVKVGARIYRKDLIGNPGKVYGAQADIHLEVCCDETQLIQLTGNRPAWRNPFDESRPEVPKANGRTDAVFGDLYIFLPPGTATATSPPTDHLRSRTGPARTLGARQWVRIRYDKGQGYITSLDMSGQPVGAVKHETDFEYRLYDRACELHRLVGPQVIEGLSSPSAWYELLRFGRLLDPMGPVPLPIDAAHWREIPTVNGTVWADLNAPGSCKFSDADFPAIAGWNFFADDRDHLDQRCQSANMDRWIGDPLLPPAERYKTGNLSARLGVKSVREKLKRAICFFPTEWDQTTIDARCAWVRDPKKTTPPLSDEEWERFRPHAMALTARDLPEEYKNAKWRFHPQEFVAMMKKVGWLSEAEMRQLIPEKIVRGKGAGLKGPFFYERNESKAGNLIGKNVWALNKMMRKFGINTPHRMAAFAGNSIPETGWWSDFNESHGAEKKYAPWYGRGFLQLTNPDGKFTDDSNYAKYFRFIGHTTKNIPPENLRAWRENLSKIKYEAAESAGAYWAWMQANKEADDISPNQRITLTLDAESQVNPGSSVTIYENKAFRRVSCLINLPSKIDHSDPPLNGLTDRYSAYAVAQLVLLDTAQFPQSNEALSFAPESFASRRNQ